MGFCKPDVGKKKKPYKTILIPKGTINPNENNIIEIPPNLETISSLILKPSNNMRRSFFVEPYRYSDLQNLSCVETSASTENNLNSKESHQNAEYRNMPNDAHVKFKTDFGTQTEQFQQNQIPILPFCYAPNLNCFSYSQKEIQDASITVCPICAQPSCKYIPSHGVIQPRCYNIQPLSNEHPQYYPPRPNSGITDLYGAHSKTPIVNEKGKNFRVPIHCTKNEISKKNSSKEQMDYTKLDQIIDEKIDKILNPIIMSLRKSFSEEDESEVCQKCLGSPPAYGHMYMEMKHSLLSVRKTNSHNNDSDNDSGRSNFLESGSHRNKYFSKTKYKNCNSAPSHNSPDCESKDAIKSKKITYEDDGNDDA